MAYQINQEIKALVLQAEHTFKEYETYEIVTMEGYGASGECLKNIKAKQNEIEKKRLAITRPMNEALKEANDLFRPAKDFLKRAEEIVKSAMLLFKQKIDEENRKKEREREAAAQVELDKALKSKNMSKISDAIIKKYDEPEYKAAEASGIHTKKIWKFKVIDFNAIPKHWLIVNENWVMDKCRQSKGKAQIPGILFYQDEVVASRSA